MSVRIDTAVIGTMRKFGAFDVNQCFHCGNCTAVCPLSKGTDNFPRRMIRYAQIGDSKRLLASKELWLCYYCGECSDTCPRQAEPGEFMASARRYAIASLDPTGISRLLYTSRWFAAFFLTALSILLALVLLARRGVIESSYPALFQFLPFEVVHKLGAGVILVAVLAMVAGVVRLVWALTRAESRAGGNGDRGDKRPWLKRVGPAIRAVAGELGAEGRYRDCEVESKEPWYRSRWFMHWTIMWGFLGLLTATILDYLLLLLVGKVPGQPVPLWEPIRLLGTLAGLLMIYGTSLAMVFRFRKSDKYSSHSLQSDWLLIWLLFLTGLTGFVVEISLYLPGGSPWAYAVFLVHVVLGMEVVILLPFTKFAHAVYRPLALFIYNLRDGSAQ